MGTFAVTLNAICIDILSLAQAKHNQNLSVEFMAKKTALQRMAIGVEQSAV